MKINDLNEVFSEIKEKGKKVKNKDDWWAGKTKNDHFGDDWFIGHPEAGLYQFKSYRKNPYQPEGVGAKLTKNVDDEIKNKFEKNTNSLFGVLPKKIKKSRKRRAKRLIDNKEFKDPKNLFEELLSALGINIRGNLSHSKKGEPKPVKEFKSDFEEEQKELTEEFKKILNKDDVYNSYV